MSNQTNTMSSVYEQLQKHMLNEMQYEVARSKKNLYSHTGEEQRGSIDGVSHADRSVFHGTKHT